MGNFASTELKSKIRQKVENGSPRYDVAREFNISPKNVYNWTNDLPKMHCGRRKIPDKTRKKIIKYVESGMPRIEVAKTFGVSTSFVNRLTMDLSKKQGNTGIRGGTLNLLKVLMKDGFYVPKREDTNQVKRSYRYLKGHVPVKSVIVRNRPVYFMEGKEKEAMKAFLSKTKKTTMSYFNFKKMSSLFGITLSKTDKEEILFGKFRMEKYANKFKILKNVKKCFRQSVVSDFIGRILHSELLDSCKLLNSYI
ncbi:MAG: hypothetical protein KAS04_01805 [Candidatus Aenigmarchaeota archaeon]|nr:hypothetical protein [Candidatus Aenigmarchaeota archaeon]